MNGRALAKQSAVSAPFERLTLPIAKKFDEHMQYSSDKDLKLVFGRLARGVASYNDADEKKTTKISSEMSKIYSTTKVCELNDTNICYNLSPYLERLMQTEKNYDRLLWAWKGWHDGCGNKIRPLYVPYINLLDKKVQENGYKDLAVSGRSLIEEK